MRWAMWQDKPVFIVRSATTLCADRGTAAPALIRSYTGGTSHSRMDMSAWPTYSLQPASQGSTWVQPRVSPDFFSPLSISPLSLLGGENEEYRHGFS
jgi:hypothetical protein